VTHISAIAIQRQLRAARRALHRMLSLIRRHLRDHVMQSACIFVSFSFNTRSLFKSLFLRASSSPVIRAGMTYRFTDYRLYLEGRSSSSFAIFLSSKQTIIATRAQPARVSARLFGDASSVNAAIVRSLEESATSRNRAS